MKIKIKILYIAYCDSAKRVWISTVLVHVISSIANRSSNQPNSHTQFQFCWAWPSSATACSNFLLYFSLSYYLFYSMGSLDNQEMLRPLQMSRFLHCLCKLSFSYILHDMQTTSWMLKCNKRYVECRKNATALV